MYNDEKIMIPKKLNIKKTSLIKQFISNCTLNNYINQLIII